MRESRRSSVWLTMICLAAASIGAVAAGLLVGPLRARAAGPPSYDNGELNGVHQVAVFLASSSCGACRTRGLDDAVRQLLDSLRSVAASEGRRLTTVGVLLEPPSAEALEWLARFGAFDEISVGGNWLNTAAARYVWKGQASASVPQLLLVRYRVIEERSSMLSNPGLVIGSDSIVRSWQGVGQLAPLLVQMPS